MRLEPLYRAEFTTQEAWSVDLTGAAGTEGQNFLIVAGRSAGRLSARMRAANFPRRRTDGVLTPDFRGVLECDDGAVVLFTWRGYGRTVDGVRQLIGSITHLTADDRYRWLNDTVGALTGEVRARDDGSLDVVIDVAEVVWEPGAAP